MGATANKYGKEEKKQVDTVPKYKKRKPAKERNDEGRGDRKAFA